MNCWEILGIDPTRDRAAIDQAYEQQKKFATDEDLAQLQQAYREASGQEQSDSAGPVESVAEETQPGTDGDLSAEEHQIVREVVIQVKALLNDSRRAADVGIWRAILTEPPADKPALRSAVASALESQVRPMADNGSFSFPVVAFLGDWFGWSELQEKAQQPASQENPEADQAFEAASEEADSQPATTSFWPAVIGWVVALAILAAFFEGMLGG